MARKALLIGINYIGSRGELNGCINDVINIKKFLKEEFQFQDSEIRVMTEVAESSCNLPTKKNILAGFDWLIENNDENSNLFLHFSGHGTYMIDHSGDEVDGYDEAICPLDYATAGMIVDDDIHDILIKPLKMGAHLFFICDSCHSGTMADLKYTYYISRCETSTSYTVNSDANYRPTACDVILISGCTDDQTSADAIIQGKAQGALTFSFLQTYRKLKAENKPLTYKRLMKNILIEIRKRGFTQIPQISTGKFMDLHSTIRIA